MEPPEPALLLCRLHTGKEEEEEEDSSPRLLMDDVEVEAVGWRAYISTSTALNIIVRHMMSSASPVQPPSVPEFVSPGNDMPWMCAPLPATQVGVVFPMLFALVMQRVRRGPLALLPGRRLLLVTAHPDDETMFFGPVLLGRSGHQQISLLCLSTGDADGQGETRRKELAAACDKLGIA
jgi:hypothetical protein